MSVSPLVHFCPVTGVFLCDEHGAEEAPLAMSRFPELFERHCLDPMEGIEDVAELVSSSGGRWTIDHERSTAYILCFRGERERVRLAPRRRLPYHAVEEIAGALERVGRDAELLAGVRSFGVARSGTRFWLDVDWYDRDRWVPVPRLSSADAEPVLELALASLADLHARGVVHGAIDPGCLMMRVSAGRDLRIAGFGLAPAIAVQRTDAFDGLGTSTGDPRYMAPEVALGVAPGPASDVYATAAALAVLLGAGAPADLGAGPFLGRAGRDRRVMLRAVDWLEPPCRARPAGGDVDPGRWRQPMESFSPRLQELLVAMLQPLPGDRRPSCPAARPSELALPRSQGGEAPESVGPCALNASKRAPADADASGAGGGSRARSAVSALAPAAPRPNGTDGLHPVAAGGVGHLRRSGGGLRMRIAMLVLAIAVPGATWCLFAPDARPRSTAPLADGDASASAAPPAPPPAASVPERRAEASRRSGQTPDERGALEHGLEEEVLAIYPALRDGRAGRSCPSRMKRIVEQVAAADVALVITLRGTREDTMLASRVEEILKRCAATARIAVRTGPWVHVARAPTDP